MVEFSGIYGGPPTLYPRGEHDPEVLNKGMGLA